jgi:hypothetical protein
MLKRLAVVILSAGLLLGVTPVAASAHGGGGGSRYDDHYRCMYRCRGDYYYRRGDRDRDPRYCWYKDRYGWYRARCYRHSHRDDYGGGYYRDHRDHDR